MTPRAETESEASGSSESVGPEVGPEFEPPTHPSAVGVLAGPATTLIGEPSASTAIPVKPKRVMSRALKIGSVALAIVGTVTGVVGVIPILWPNASGFDSLEFTVEPIVSTSLERYAVAVDAAFETFPVSTDGCDVGQQAWLAENGTLLEDRYLLEMGNRATQGAMLTLKDIRGVGEATEPATTSVRIECDLGAASTLRVASLNPVDGSSAVFRGSGAASAGLPDNPVMYTLAPGEIGQIAIELDSSLDFRGEIVVTVVSGREEREVVLPFGADLSVPGLSSDSGARFSVVGGRLSCAEVREDCDATAVLASLAG